MNHSTYSWENCPELQPTAAPLRCPRCDSPAPNLHPAVQHEGEVTICPDPWHAPKGGERNG